MTDPLREIEEQTEQLYNVHLVLQSLCGSLDVVGMTTLCKKVATIARIVDTSVVIIRRAKGRIIDEQVRVAEQSSRNMLYAAMAATQICPDCDGQCEGIKDDKSICIYSRPGTWVQYMGKDLPWIKYKQIVQVDYTMVASWRTDVFVSGHAAPINSVEFQRP